MNSLFNKLAPKPLTALNTQAGLTNFADVNKLAPPEITFGTNALKPNPFSDVNKLAGSGASILNRTPIKPITASTIGMPLNPEGINKLAPPEITFGTNALKPNPFSDVNKLAGTGASSLNRTPIKPITASAIGMPLNPEGINKLAPPEISFGTNALKPNPFSDVNKLAGSGASILNRTPIKPLTASTIPFDYEAIKKLLPLQLTKLPLEPLRFTSLQSDIRVLGRTTSVGFGAFENNAKLRSFLPTETLGIKAWTEEEYINPVMVKSKPVVLPLSSEVKLPLHVSNYSRVEGHALTLNSNLIIETPQQVPVSRALVKFADIEDVYPEKLRLFYEWRQNYDKYITLSRAVSALTEQKQAVDINTLHSLAQAKQALDENTRQLINLGLYTGPAEQTIHGVLPDVAPAANLEPIPQEGRFLSPASRK
jgi:hypothetical protein